MSVAEAITQRVKYMEKGKPFASNLFMEVGPRTSVDKALSRMVKAGKLERVRQGVYMRPKPSQFFGTARPSPLAVLEAVTKSRGEKIQVHGAEALRKLGLSTQTPMAQIFYTNGTSRQIIVGKAIIQLRHASEEKLQGAGTRVGVAISAMHYLGKEGLTSQHVKRIVQSLTPTEQKKLRACRMPEWMRAALEYKTKEEG